MKYSHGSLQITCKMFILQTDCLQNQNLGLGLGVSCCMETQVGSQEFSTALLKLLWGHRDQRAVVCDIKRCLSDSQKKWKCPDSTDELTVPCVHLMKLVKLLAGVLETCSNATDHKPSYIPPLLCSVLSGAEINSGFQPGFPGPGLPADLYTFWAFSFPSIDKLDF